MKTRCESIEKLRDLVDVQLKRFQVTIKHYHADGAAELIGKQVVQILKRKEQRTRGTPPRHQN